ncbi:MAG: hypothetical protein ACRD11_06210 [Terriglobia bacterium]
MNEPAKRLGDLIDDYCPRCRLLLNHAVASIVNGDAVKVICQTCFTEHPYRHSEGGKKKPPNVRAKLFSEVSAKLPAPATPADPPTASKRRSDNPARYISRHPSKSPQKKR